MTKSMEFHRSGTWKNIQPFYMDCWYREEFEAKHCTYQLVKKRTFVVDVVREGYKMILGFYSTWNPVLTGFNFFKKS